MSNDSSDDGEWFPVMVRKRCFEALFLKLVFLDSFPLCCTSVRTPEGVALVWCADFVRPADFADPLVARGDRGDGGLLGRTLTIAFLGRVGTRQNKWIDRRETYIFCLELDNVMLLKLLRRNCCICPFLGR